MVFPWICTRLLLQRWIEHKTGHYHSYTQKREKRIFFFGVHQKWDRDVMVSVSLNYSGEANTKWVMKRQWIIQHSLFYFTSFLMNKKPGFYNPQQEPLRAIIFSAQVRVFKGEVTSDHDCLHPTPPRRGAGHGLVALGKGWGQFWHEPHLGLISDYALWATRCDKNNQAGLGSRRFWEDWAAAEELQTWLMMDIQLPISHEAQLKHTHFKNLIFIIWLMSYTDYFSPGKKQKNKENT